MCFFISFLIGVISTFLFKYFRYLVCIFLSAFLGFHLFKKEYSKLVIMCVGLSVGILFSYIRMNKEFSLNDNLVVTGVFETYPSLTKSGLYKQGIRVNSAFDVIEGRYIEELVGKKIELFFNRGFEFGTEGKLLVRFFGNKRALNPGSNVKDELSVMVLKVFDIEDTGSSFVGKIEKYRYRINEYIMRNFDKDSAGFLCSITTGYKEGITKEIRDAFNRTGISHILSISGTHFGLFSLSVFFVIRTILRFVPYKLLVRITIFLTPLQLSSILCIPFMLLYLCLSGASIPAVRAFIMTSLFLIGLLINRKGSWLSFLVFSAFIIVLWNPENIKSISFQLSFLAVLFIGFALNYSKDYKERNVFSKKIRDTLLITLSATIGTSTLIAYYFNYVSLISPITNLLITPIIGFIVIPLSVFSCFIFLLTGKFMSISLISFVTGFSIQLVKYLSSISYSALKVPVFPLIIVVLFYFGFVPYLLLKRRKHLLLLPFLPIIVYIIFCIFKKEELSVTFLDVNQGDSAVVELPSRKVIVIDTGRTGYETLSFLRYIGKDNVDALVISHVHPDHSGGALYILRELLVDELWDNGKITYPVELSNIRHRLLEKGDVVEYGSSKIYVLHPYSGFYTMFGNEHDEANNDSLVLKVIYKNNSILFTGDIEEEAQKELLNLGTWLKSDVIKIPHHGAKSSAYEPFFEIVSPKIAVISLGKGNPFGHPHKEMLDIISNSDVYRTDVDGAIKVSITESSIKVKTFREFGFMEAKSLKDELRNVKCLFETW